MYGFASNFYALKCVFVGLLDADYASKNSDIFIIPSKNATKLKNKQKIYTIKLAEGFDQGIFNNTYGRKIKQISPPLNGRRYFIHPNIKLLSFNQEAFISTFNKHQRFTCRKWCIFSFDISFTDFNRFNVIS